MLVSSQRRKAFPGKTEVAPGLWPQGANPGLLWLRMSFLGIWCHSGGHPGPVQPVFSMRILQEKLVLWPRLDTPQSQSTRAARPPARRPFAGPAENVGPEAFCQRLGVSRQAPGRTRSPAGAARSAQAEGPWWWGRRCSPQARI